MRLAPASALLALVSIAACGGSEDAVFGTGAGGAGGATATSATGAGGQGGDAGSSATITSTSSGSSGTGGGMTCADFGDPCTICESTQCAEAYCTCAANPDCALLYQCVAPCPPGDLDCQQACWTAHEEGISDGALVLQCAATTCSEACPGFTPLSECQVCLFNECEAQMNTCLANPDCTNLILCLQGCTTTDCQNGCYAAHSGGIGDAGPVGMCLQESSCEAICQ